MVAAWLSVAWEIGGLMPYLRAVLPLTKPGKDDRQRAPPAAARSSAVRPERTDAVQLPRGTAGRAPEGARITDSAMSSARSRALCCAADRVPASKPHVDTSVLS